MSDSNLDDKFPDMQPLRSAPTLMTINGIGLSMYGSRDYDEDTRTYVKTRCACLLFVPIVAVDAYRVADAPTGWYFLGRVPLSSVARVWNFMLLAFLLVGGGLWGWHQHTHTPEYQAGRQMAEAAQLAEAGQIVKAARLYRDVASGNTDHAREAAERIKDLLDQPVSQASPTDAAEVFKIALELRSRYPALGNVFQRGMAVVNQHADADPAGALAVLEAVTPVAPDARELTAKRQQLLECVVAQEPDNPEPAAKLSLILEGRQEWDKCEALLTPHANRLGTTEGARILGQIYAHQGKVDQAHALLVPYTEGRLKQLHAAEQAFTAAYTKAQAQIVENLNNHQAPGFDYIRHKAVPHAEQQAMVHEYIQSTLKDHPDVVAAQEAVVREAHVVPVAIDLGVVFLRRGQALADPAARKAELEKAEKTFLAVRGLASQSDSYRLTLGQVYYWLGKHAEGRKLFDELLEAQKRSGDILLGVSRLLREVGAHSEARSLAEEAYNSAKEPAKKYEAAIFRTLLPIDLDDEIAWLRRANPADLDVKASLSTALGQKALQQGNESEAARHLREAIELYGRQTTTASTLNNGALAYFSLYTATGDRTALDKGVESLDKAIALQPSDSILLSNAARSVLGVALRDIIGAEIDVNALKITGRQELLAYLYRDRAGRDEYIRRVRQHKGVAKAIAYYERLLVLAPKNADAYTTLAALHRLTRNLDGLRSLEKRLEEVELDLTDATRETLDYLAGKKDAKYQQDLKTALDRSEKLVAQTRKGSSKATFAVAATWLASQQIYLADLGQRVDADRIVALAEEAHAAAPSRATQSYLSAALLFRAHRTLIAKEPAYAVLAARAGRPLGASYLVATVLSRDGPARDPARNHSDVQRVLATPRSFPDEPSPWEWAILRDVRPDEAAALAQAIRQDDIGRAERAIELRLAPVSASVALQAYWAMQLAGEEPKGLAILKACADRGVPFPFELK